MDSYTEIWERVSAKLSEKFSSALNNLLFKNASLIFLSDHTAVIDLKNDNLLDLARQSYVAPVREFIGEVTGFSVDVIFDSSEKKDIDLGQYLLIPTNHTQRPVSVETKSEPEISPFGSTSVVVNRHFTFDNFIVGSSNKFAHAACEAVAREGTSAGYNPLFIYGNSGLGKTHLLNAIVNETLKLNPAAKIVLAKGDDFTNEIVEAIRHATTQQFREKYRKADLLLIDDIQFIAGKEGIQEEFFHTFNTLFEDNKQIVLSSDRPPRDIKPLEDRLKGRFEWGLLADIQPPDYELRIAIMKDKANSYNVDFPPEVFAFLAENLKENIRQMEGAVRNIASRAMLNASSPSLELAAECISDMIISSSSNAAMCERIISTVSKKYGISEEDMKSKKRNNEIAHARHIAIFIMRKLTDMSLQEIGNEFGGRNYTTVLNSIDVMEKEIKTSPLLDLEISDMIKEIKE